MRLQLENISHDKRKYQQQQQQNYFRNRAATFLRLCRVSIVVYSVTRLGDSLNFAQVFKPFGNNYFAQISHILRQILKMCQNL